MPPGASTQVPVVNPLKWNINLGRLITYEMEKEIHLLLYTGPLQSLIWSMLTTSNV